VTGRAAFRASFWGLAWLFGLATASLRADSYVLPAGGDGLVGWQGVTIARQEDTLADIARTFKLGHEEIRLANPDIDFWLPGAGARAVLPTRFVLPRAERKGIVLNVPEMRLYFFPAARPNEDPVVVTYPISIGRMDWSTPLGRHRITSKIRNPSWTPPASILKEAEAAGEPLPKFIPSGPDNPLGAFALRLDLPSYLIHGTNLPYGVGMRVTHGCIRMYPEDIERLFSQVQVGTPVNIVNQPVKVGWLGDTLFMEVHPPLEEDPVGEEELRRLALELVEEADSERSVELLGRELLRVVSEKRGIPEAISRGTEK
jgi:L,D-transpeptidase ErfK/SrfK